MIFREKSIVITADMKYNMRDGRIKSNGASAANYTTHIAGV